MDAAPPYRQPFSLSLSPLSPSLILFSRQRMDGNVRARRIKFECGSHYWECSQGIVWLRAPNVKILLRKLYTVLLSIPSPIPDTIYLWCNQPSYPLFRSAESNKQHTLRRDDDRGTDWHFQSIVRHARVSLFPLSHSGNVIDQRRGGARILCLAF